MPAISRYRRATLVVACVFVSGHPVWAGQPKTHQVDISAFKFLPERVIVRVGDTILFVNKDLVPHTATAQEASWDTGEIRGGAEKAYKFEQVGRFVYICRYHPAMQGVVEVKP
jgi:plastocyanin